MADVDQNGGADQPHELTLREMMYPNNMSLRPLGITLPTITDNWELSSLRDTSLHHEVEDVEFEFVHEVEDVANEFVTSTAIELEEKLAPRCLVDGVDQAFLLYCAYAKHTVFSVRKGNQERFGQTKVVLIKTFVCSYCGLTPTAHINGRLAVYKKYSTRCNCEALLRVARVKGWPWKKSMLEALNSTGIPISRACRFMENEAGGPENVGFIRRDVYHHMDNVRRKSKMADGDSTALMQYFVDKSNKETFFYWNMQKDDEGRLMNFFYRDSRSALDYEYFGDVLFVGITYKMNKLI
ncbi:protein FAR1-RELATED SEQUENCE 5-like [Salvia miltiorrhiza]|uniref:protein FAR1-RELATED SEQUENCE 5-like n=1 Tax=Salvia miltiorrhiza TaxID=226208 RepID=UPI0025AC9060|nr:protein FAR1-RELATED SEQUENCE 5-like [Salvia miltiorrhiza]